MFTVSNDVPKEIKEAIVKMVDKKGNLSSAKVNYAPEWFKQWFKEHEDVMSPRALFNLIKNGLDYIPFCEYCHTTQLTPWQYQKGHYYCCNQHAQLDKKTQDKIAKAFEKYENGHPLKDSSVRKRIMETNLERYGNVVACNAENVRQRIAEETMEKYGVDHHMKRKDVQERRKETYKQNALEKYGVENPSQLDSVKLKMSETKKRKCWPIMLNTAKNNDLEILSTLDEYLAGKPFEYACTKCDTVFESEWNPSHVLCPECKQIFVSNKEREVADWVRSVYRGTVDTSNKSILNPYELDIYIPDKKVAIEFDGVYWHSNQFKEKDYHQKKTFACKNKGIRLIHVPELVWGKQNKIIKGIIKNALGLTENKIYARDTEVTEIDSLTYRMFLLENHIQGSVDSKYKYGLLYNGDLVSVIGFGESRFKKGEQELHRFCSKLDYNVVGGFQKLLKHSGFHGVSYVDLNYFDGSGYLTAGFEFVSITEPSYVYVHMRSGRILSRYQAQKHKLESLLEHYDPELTEEANMLANGYFRIYDSGTMKLKYE